VKTRQRPPVALQARAHGPPCCGWTPAAGMRACWRCAGQGRAGWGTLTAPGEACTVHSSQPAHLVPGVSPRGPPPSTSRAPRQTAALPTGTCSAAPSRARSCGHAGAGCGRVRRAPCGPCSHCLGAPALHGQHGPAGACPCLCCFPARRAAQQPAGALAAPLGAARGTRAAARAARARGGRPALSTRRWAWWARCASRPPGRRPQTPPQPPPAPATPARRACPTSFALHSLVRSRSQ